MGGVATHQVQQPRVVAAIVLLRLGASALDRLDGRHVERPIARQFSHVIEDLLRLGLEQFLLSDLLGDFLQSEKRRDALAIVAARRQVLGQ